MEELLKENVTHRVLGLITFSPDSVTWSLRGVCVDENRAFCGQNITLTSHGSQVNSKRAKMPSQLTLTGWLTGEAEPDQTGTMSTGTKDTECSLQLFLHSSSAFDAEANLAGITCQGVGSLSRLNSLCWEADFTMVSSNPVAPPALDEFDLERQHSLDLPGLDVGPEEEQVESELLLPYKRTLEVPRTMTPISPLDDDFSLTFATVIAKGKKLRCDDWFDSPEPMISNWDYLGAEKIRVFWKIPYFRKGQVVKMSVCLKNASPRKSKARNLKVSGARKVFDPSSLYCETDIVGVAAETSDDQDERLVTFPYLALGFQDKNKNPGFEPFQPQSFYEHNTFSFVFDKVVEGNYTLEVTVENPDFSTSQNLKKKDVQKTSRPASEKMNILVSPPPAPPLNVCAMLCKSRLGKHTTQESEEAEVIYEPFVLVSWTPNSTKMCKQNHKRQMPKCMNGGTESFELSLQVLVQKTNAWVDFGEKTQVKKTNQHINLTKESCAMVALPEYSNEFGGVPLYSKFRVVVRSCNRFGTSEDVYSREFDIPQVNIMTKDERTTIDFGGCDEANCVICSEEIKFDDIFEDVDQLIMFVRNRVCDPHDEYGQDFKIYQGIMDVNSKLNLCPVTPCCCSHLFHLKCLLDWSKASRERYEHDHSDKVAPRCPLCMQPFKYLIRQSLEPKHQNSIDRNIFCAKATLRDEEQTRPLPFRPKMQTLPVGYPVPN